MDDMKFKLKALLVEDENMARRVGAIILKQVNCDVAEAATGHQALELSQNTLFDIIFMDLGLPDLNGFEVTKTIREGNTQNKATPIVALTAHDNEEDRKKCSAAGMSEFLTKPLDSEKALEVFKKLNLKI